jgi:type I restriction enzyme, S subunit
VANAFPFLRVGNVPRGGLELSDVHLIELFDGELDRYRLEVGDLLVVEGNGSPTEIGRAAVWDGSIDDCVHQNHLIRVRPLPGIDPAFLGHAWNAPQVVEHLMDVSSSTSGLHTLSCAKVNAVRLPIPPTSEQSRIVLEVERRLSRLQAGIRSLEAAQRKLLTTRMGSSSSRLHSVS